MRKKKSEELEKVIEYVKIVNDFHTLLEKSQGMLVRYKAMKYKVEGRLCDVNHFIEKKEFCDLKTKRKIYKLQKDLLEERRRIKDLLLILNPLATLLTFEGTKKDDREHLKKYLVLLDENLQEINRNYDYIISDREYVPREMPELFEGIKGVRL